MEHASLEIWPWRGGGWSTSHDMWRIHQDLCSRYQTVTGPGRQSWTSSAHVGMEHSEIRQNCFIRDEGFRWFLKRISYLALKACIGGTINEWATGKGFDYLTEAALSGSWVPRQREEWKKTVHLWVYRKKNSFLLEMNLIFSLFQRGRYSCCPEELIGVEES